MTTGGEAFGGGRDGAVMIVLGGCSGTSDGCGKVVRDSLNFIRLSMYGFRVLVLALLEQGRGSVTSTGRGGWFFFDDVVPADVTGCGKGGKAGRNEWNNDPSESLNAPSSSSSSPSCSS